MVETQANDMALAPVEIAIDARDPEPAGIAAAHAAEVVAEQPIEPMVAIAPDAAAESAPAIASELAVEAPATPAVEADRAERLRSLFDQARESEPDVATTTNAAPPAPSPSDQAGDDQAPRSA